MKRTKSYGPPRARQWGTIWAVAVEASKYGQHQIHHDKESDNERDNNGYHLVDCVKEYHQADKKQEYREVKEHHGHRNFGKPEVLVCPLMLQCNKQGGRDAKDKAQ